MPAAFLGHGNPMNALPDHRYTRAWRSFGEAVPHPRAILVSMTAYTLDLTCPQAAAVTGPPSEMASGAPPDGSNI